MSYPTSPVPKPLSIENTPAKKYLVALLMFDSILAVGRNNKEVIDEIQAEVTATGTLTDAQEAGTWVYLRFTDSGRAYAFSKKEVKNLRRWFGDDLKQWDGKQVKIFPVVRAGISGKEVRKLSLSAV